MEPALPSGSAAVIIRANEHRLAPQLQSRLRWLFSKQPSAEQSASSYLCLDPKGVGMGLSPSWDRGAGGGGCVCARGTGSSAWGQLSVSLVGDGHHKTQTHVRSDPRGMLRMESLRKQRRVLDLCLVSP